MHEVNRQLEKVRSRGRTMLLAQRLGQWLAGFIVLALALVMLDYLLRLPGWIRLILGLAAAGVAGAWLISRLARAWRFKPDLAVLALRAEQLYPRLSGMLASGVEFTAHPEAYAQPQRTAGFARLLVSRLDQQLGGVSLNRLLEPSRTLRWSGAAMAALVVLAGLVIVAPGSSLLAAQRWLLPLGSAEWPRRTAIEALTQAQVWPIDTPLMLEAAVPRGYRPGMRAWAQLRLISPDGQAGPWRSLLMNDQGTIQRNHRDRDRDAQGHSGQRAAWPATLPPEAGLFQRLIDLTEEAGSDRLVADSRVEFHFQAGDDVTARRSIRLVERPAVRQVQVEVQPPTYAVGLISTPPVRLDGQTGMVATTTALRGSTMTLRLWFNKPVPVVDDQWQPLLPGLTAIDAQLVASDDSDRPAGDSGRRQLTLRFRLDQTVQTAIALVDEHGLTNQSERQYRIEAVEDRPPAVSLVEPPADEAVLATAVVPIEAVAQDDVGVERLHIALEAPMRSEAGGPATRSDSVLAEVEDRRSRLTLEHTLDLARLNLLPGDELTLTAVARDVFDLHGTRHDPVVSSPRKLRVIDEAALIGQIRTDLAALRQQAIRLESTQRQLLDLPPEQAGPQQQQVSRRLTAQRALLDGLSQRMARNRLNEPILDQLMEQAEDLLERAQGASREAGEQLQQAQEVQAASQQREHAAEARRQQEEVGQAIRELVNLLDQGRDALTLQLQLRQLMTQQEALSADTRRILPRTAGQAPEDLSPEDQRRLAELTERQRSLAEQAQDLSRQMQTTADALSRQSDTDADRAAAEALRQAAEIAQRQGLSQTMEQAAESTQDNRLSEAGQQQLDAMDTMSQMMRELGTQERRRQEMLRRRLAQLIESIRRLVEQQGQQIAVLDSVEAAQAAESLPLLAPAQTALRRNTIDVEDQARRSNETEPVAEELTKAVSHQGEAILALRAADRHGAGRAEQSALEQLEAALALAQRLREEAQQQQAQQQRDELEQAYRALARQQQEIRNATAELDAIEQPTRQQRAALIEQGHAQADLQIAAAELREKVDQTVIFQQAHRRIDESAARVVTQLRAARSDELLLAEQDLIRSMLLLMADALKSVPRDEPFAGQEPEEGGAGGGGGGDPPLVPPIAELRLLRGLQEGIYDQTKLMQRAAERPDADRRAIQSRLLDLSVRQRELSDLGERLIQSLQPPTGGPPMEESR